MKTYDWTRWDGDQKQQKTFQCFDKCFCLFSDYIVVIIGYEEDRSGLKYISPIEDSCITDKLTDSCKL